MSRLMTVREQLILAGLALALLVGAATVVWTGDAPADTAFVVPETDARPVEQASFGVVDMEPATRVVVDAVPVVEAPVALEEPVDLGVAVMGAVRRPGYYVVPPNSRVDDLIAAAGGATNAAVVQELNLAAPLLDGTTLTVPFAGGHDENGLVQPGAAYNPPAYLLMMQVYANLESVETVDAVPQQADHASGTGALIDLNTAPQATLETLPGIGPALAQRIIAFREAQPFQTVDDLDKVSGIGEKRLDAVRALVTVSP